MHKRTRPAGREKGGEQMNEYSKKKVEMILNSGNPEYGFELEIRQQVDKLIDCNDYRIHKELNEHINYIIDARAEYLDLP